MIAVVLDFCLSDQDIQENTLNGGFLILTHSFKGLIPSWWGNTVHIMVARVGVGGQDGRLFGLALSSPHPILAGSDPQIAYQWMLPCQSIAILSVAVGALLRCPHPKSDHGRIAGLTPSLHIWGYSHRQSSSGAPG